MGLDPTALDTPVWGSRAGQGSGGAGAAPLWTSRGATPSLPQANSSLFPFDSMCVLSI